MCYKLSFRTAYDYCLMERKFWCLIAGDDCLTWQRFLFLTAVGLYVITVCSEVRPAYSFHWKCRFSGFHLSLMDVLCDFHFPVLQGSGGQCSSLKFLLCIITYCCNIFIVIMNIQLFVNMLVVKVWLIFLLFQLFLRWLRFARSLLLPRRPGSTMKIMQICIGQ